MTTYKINNIDVAIKIGTFVAVGNTSSFTSGARSDGWIICDGVLRTNTNGIYTNLANLGIGALSNADANYTPPNLNGRILTGKNSTGSSVNINTTQGSNSVTTLSSGNLPPHNHSISFGDATHTHTYSDKTPSFIAGQQAESNNVGSTNCIAKASRNTDSTNDAHTHTVTVSGVTTATGTSILIKNRAFHIVWIVKYA
jgi:microcystin-dependent protein